MAKAKEDKPKDEYAVFNRAVPAGPPNAVIPPQPSVEEVAELMKARAASNAAVLAEQKKTEAAQDAQETTETKEHEPLSEAPQPQPAPFAYRSTFLPPPVNLERYKPGTDLETIHALELLERIYHGNLLLPQAYGAHAEIGPVVENLKGKVLA